jgi:hypothetical protein
VIDEKYPSRSILFGDVGIAQSLPHSFDMDNRKESMFSLENFFKRALKSTHCVFSYRLFRFYLNYTRKDGREKCGGIVTAPISSFFIIHFFSWYFCL